MEWREAIEFARDIRLCFLEDCERVEIAGSLRRLKPDVGDIEIVAVPKREPFDRLSMRIAVMIDRGLLAHGFVSKDGKKAPAGPRYYRLRDPASGLHVDVFAVLPPADWGVIFTIRTGSADFSHWIVTEALRKGMKVKEGHLIYTDKTKQPWEIKRVPCEEEIDFFNALGLEWILPQEREEPPPVANRLATVEVA